MQVLLEISLIHELLMSGHGGVREIMAVETIIVLVASYIVVMDYILVRMRNVMMEIRLQMMVVHNIVRLNISV